VSRANGPTGPIPRCPTHSGFRHNELDAELLLELVTLLEVLTKAKQIG